MTLRRGCATCGAAHVGKSLFGRAATRRPLSARLALGCGASLGASDPVDRAMLPVLEVRPGGYGLYTMAPKRALGSTGPAQAWGAPIFTPAEHVTILLSPPFRAR